MRPANRSASAAAHAALFLAGHGVAAQKLALADAARGLRHNRFLRAAGIGDQHARPQVSVQVMQRIQDAADRLGQVDQVRAGRGFGQRDAFVDGSALERRAQGCFGTDSQDPAGKARLLAAPGQTSRR